MTISSHHIAELAISINVRVFESDGITARGQVVRKVAVIGVGKIGSTVLDLLVDCGDYEAIIGGGRDADSDSWRVYMRRATNSVNFGRSRPLAQGVRFDI